VRDSPGNAASSYRTPNTDVGRSEYRAASREFDARGRASGFFDFRERRRRAEKSRSGGEFEIVGAVGNQPVAKGFEDLPFLQEESAGHALHVASGKADEVAFQPGHQHAVDTFAVEVLA
jgi:hypothetical protein